MIELYDYYNEDSQKLHQSLKAAGYKNKAFVIEDNGFSSDEVTSIFGYYLDEANKQIKDYKKPKWSPEYENARYFNEIDSPDFWEISASNTEGEIHDKQHLRGKMYFANLLQKRLVWEVKWFDEEQRHRYSDYYDQYGNRSARLVLSDTQQRIVKKWYSADNKEIIVENYVTGSIILNQKNKVLFFRSKTEFVAYFIINSKADFSTILFNSLSTPFFVSNYIGNQREIPGTDILFWHEQVGENIPGNMVGIVNGTVPRAKKVLLQIKQAADRINELDINKSVFQNLGYIYNKSKSTPNYKKILIMTNSDQLESADILAEKLPDFEINICAITEMSSKLLSMDRYSNVALYPNISEEKTAELLAECGIYLDINHFDEIVNSIERSYLNNALILANKATLHKSYFVAEENIYPTEEYDSLVKKIKKIASDAKYRANLMKKQDEAAWQSSPREYADVLTGILND